MIWPFKRRDVGPCVDCRWYRGGEQVIRHECAHPRVVLIFHPVDGSPAGCVVARACGMVEGPCFGGRLFERAGRVDDKEGTK